MMSNGQKPFELGLVMAGAISAGAYTAGVIDFLLQALEAWDKAKKNGEAVPTHDVHIRAMSGSSAGAMTAAILARALGTEVTPVSDVSHPPDDPAENPQLQIKAFHNPFYAAWVQSIDIRHLLGSNDLASKAAKLVSALDSSVLPVIGDNVLRADGVKRTEKPSYVADTVDMFLTTTNLRGIPYGFEFSGTDKKYKHMMTSYADHMRFRLSWDGSATGDEPALSLPIKSVSTVGNWGTMMRAALASGAFPGGLAPIELKRPSADYDKRGWDVPDDKPLRTIPKKEMTDEEIAARQAVVCDGANPRVIFAQCTKREEIEPTWSASVRTEREGEKAAGREHQITYWNVDGGVMNNEPLELVRRVLSQGGRNFREAERADKGVVMIDPFPNTSAAKTKFEGEITLLQTIVRLFGALKEQTRFKADELSLAAEDEIYSRFVISPAYVAGDGKNIEPAMASATLGGFGGFFSTSFRRHDFQLGRRNCQNFLRKHLVLDLQNDVFDTWNGIEDDDENSEKNKQLRDKFSWTEPKVDEAGNIMPGTQRRLTPVIPLVDRADEEVKLPVRPRAAQVDLAALRKLVRGRLDVAVPRLIADTPSRLLRWGLRAVWSAGWIFGCRRKIVSMILEKIEKDISVLG